MQDQKTDLRRLDPRRAAPLGSKQASRFGWCNSSLLPLLPPVQTHRGVQAEMSTTKDSRLEGVSPSRENRFSSEWKEGDSVPLTTIDNLELRNCRFISVDVEGMELAVLKVAKDRAPKHCGETMILVRRDAPAAGGLLSNGEAED